MNRGRQSIEDVKVDVRSILLTAPNGLLLKEFCKQYKSIVGQALPFRDFQFSSPAEFLQSIPDVVNVSWNQLDYVLRAVADEKTIHIKNLVSKQKVSKSKNSPMRRTFDKYIEPLRFYGFNNRQQAFGGQFHGGCHFLPAPVKFEVNLLMKHYPNGISFQNFLLAYRSKFGRDFNCFSMGFSSVQECLSYVPGLQFHFVNGEQRIFGSSNYNKPLLPTPSYTYNYNSWKPNASKPQSPKKSPMSKSNPSHPIPPVSSASCVPKTLPLIPKETTTQITSPSFQRIPSPVSLPTPQPTQGINELDSIEDDEVGEELDKSGISEVMKENFRKILRKNPQGTWAADFPLHYKELTGNTFDLQELGYVSLLSLTDLLPEIFRRSQPDGCKSDWLLFDASIPEKDSSVAREEEVTKNVVDVDENVISSIRRILEACPEGVFVDDFLHLYTLNCETPIRLPEVGCGSVEKFLLQIASLVPLKFNYTNARKKVEIDKTARRVSPRRCPSTKPPTPDDIPCDAVLPGLFYQWEKVPQSDSYFQMCFGTVMDPSLLWVQLIGENTSKALDTLMDQLHQFYNGPEGSNYVMREKHVIIGAICAGVWYHDSGWHRVAITGMSYGSGVVDVSFVDYGTKGKVLYANLRYLRNEFLRLPAQAIKARMAYIEPVNSIRWSEEAKDKLRNDYRDKTLMAEVVAKQLHPGFVSIWICDVSGEEDIHVNRLFIDEGYASFCASDLPGIQDPLSSIPFPSEPPCLPPPSVPSNSMETDLIQKFSSMLQSNTASLSAPVTQASDLMLRFLSGCGVELSPANLSLLHQLLSAGMSEANIIQLVSASKNIFPGQTNVLSPNQNRLLPPQSVYSPPVNPILPPNFDLSSNINGVNLMNSNLGGGVASVMDSAQAPAFLPPPCAVSTAYVEPADDGDSSPINFPDNSNASEVFDDDDEEESLDQLCSQFEPSSRRFVKRIRLMDGYVFHIVVVDQMPHVSSGDLSRLLWPDESSDCLFRRLRGKQISIASLTISQSNYPEVFWQLKCYDVCGVKMTNQTAIVSLFGFKNTIDVLNIFGHPSTTIREEMRHHLCNFNYNDDVWKSFSTSDARDYSSKNLETDSGKFKKMCIFDLKSTLEGLRYKRLKLMKSLSESTNVRSPVEEIKQIESQYKTYERRIKEIESICQSFESNQQMAC